jgi:hypothetical protein
MSICEDIYLANIGTVRHCYTLLLVAHLHTRAYMDNEIMQALLFQYIGMQWSGTLKFAFRSVVESRAWKSDITPLTRDQVKRRQAFLQESRNASTRSIEALRKTVQIDKFFLTQLPSRIEEETPYDEEPKAGEKPNQGLNAQQVLLRLVSTESHLKKALHGSCTIMRADLEWYVFSFDQAK